MLPTAAAASDLRLTRPTPVQWPFLGSGCQSGAKSNADGSVGQLAHIAAAQIDREDVRPAEKLEWAMMRPFG